MNSTGKRHLQFDQHNLPSASVSGLLLYKHATAIKSMDFIRNDQKRLVIRRCSQLGWD